MSPAAVISGQSSSFPTEPDVDVRSYWSAISRRWWLLAAGLALGAVAGFALLHGRGQTYKASAELYIGDTASAVDLPTNLALVTQYVTTESAIRAAARRAQIEPGKLRGKVSTKLVLGPAGSRLGAAPSALVDVTVSGSNPREVVRAANALAYLSSSLLARYPRLALKLTLSSLARNQTMLKDVNARLSTNLRQRQQLARSTTAASLTTISALSREIGVELKQQQLLRQEITSGRLQAVFDRSLSARVTRTAEAIPQGVPSPNSGILIGALIGVLLAALAAIAAADLTREALTAPPG